MSDRTGGTNGGTGRYSVPQAARYLGISERAVRKRIEAGTLAAERDGRQWVVFLAAVPDAVPGSTGSGTGSAGAAVPSELIEAQYRVTPAEIEQAIERTGDKYVVDMRDMFGRLDELYQERLADKDRLIVELEQQRDDERQRREAGEARLSALEAQQVASSMQPSSAPQTATDAAKDVPWWAFWKR